LNPPAAPARRTIRVVTYNVHSCIGVDRRFDPARIADVIAECRPDIVALQELGLRRPRGRRVDQAHFIASRLSMAMHFHPTIHVKEEKFGDAILSPLPSRFVRGGALPFYGEPRGALWAAILLDGFELQVINTHFGLPPDERRQQAETLLGPDWLGDPACRSPRILLGDFNAVPRSKAYRMLSRRMKDAFASTGPRRRRATFPSPVPMLRIDHIFFEKPIELVDVQVHRTRLSRIASDHLPVVADLSLPAHAAAGHAE